MNASRTKWQIVLSHTCTYFNFLNLALAALIIISGQYKHMLFMGIVILNSLIGIVQELKVKQLIDKLSVITATKAKLVTQNGIREIPVEEIKTGNVLRIAIGDQIVADSAVMSSDGLEVNESLLTGESVPVHKKSGDTLFSGTHIVAGSGTCKVIHTGEENYATTSMMHNLIKNNWTLEQLQWSLYPPGNIKEWDGLTQLFISLVESDKQLLNDSYIKKWYLLSKKEDL